MCFPPKKEILKKVKKVVKKIKAKRVFVATDHDPMLKDLSQALKSHKVWILFWKAKPLLKQTLNRPFPSSPGPLFQNEGRCSAFYMEIIFHCHANETNFHKMPHFESEGFWNSEVAQYSGWPCSEVAPKEFALQVLYKL